MLNWIKLGLISIGIAQASETSLDISRRPAGSSSGPSRLFWPTTELKKGDVADVMQGLDVPVAAAQLRKLGRGGLVGGETRDRVDGLDGGLSGRAVGAAALDLDAWQAPGNSSPFTVVTLIRRISQRP
ncbi:hypothetical protein [Kitasatospora sp. NPDC059599]|uniref:hypothetical protein n=1 Tax=Kitasatospora sp. NPDC059599 TaxID=3346880 RepID=UPI003674177E